MADTKNIIKTVGAAVSKHAPELLTAFGIANMFTGVVLAVRATPKALDILDKAEEEKGGELSKTEIIADTWKVYIPAALHRLERCEQKPLRGSYCRLYSF